MGHGLDLDLEEVGYERRAARQVLARVARVLAGVLAAPRSVSGSSARPSLVSVELLSNDSPTYSMRGCTCMYDLWPVSSFSVWLSQAYEVPAEVIDGMVSAFCAY